MKKYLITGSRRGLARPVPHPTCSVSEGIGKASECTSGQVYIELIFIVPVFAVFFIMMIFFARVYTAKIILEQAARHGVFLMAYYRYEPGQVQAELVDYLTNEKHLLKDIKAEDITVESNTGFSPSRVTINYGLPVPKYLLIHGRERGKFDISGHSECYTGTWSGEDFAHLLEGSSE
jgi:hypothetical protein